MLKVRLITKIFTTSLYHPTNLFIQPPPITISTEQTLTDYLPPIFNQKLLKLLPVSFLIVFLRLTNKTIITTNYTQIYKRRKWLLNLWLPPITRQTGQLNCFKKFS